MFDFLEVKLFGGWTKRLHLKKQLTCTYRRIDVYSCRQYSSKIAKYYWPIQTLDLDIYDTVIEENSTIEFLLGLWFQGICFELFVGVIHRNVDGPENNLQQALSQKSGMIFTIKQSHASSFIRGIQTTF